MGNVLAPNYREPTVGDCAAFWGLTFDLRVNSRVKTFDRWAEKEPNIKRGTRSPEATGGWAYLTRWHRLLFRALPISYCVNWPPYRVTVHTQCSRDEDGDGIIAKSINNTNTQQYKDSKLTLSVYTKNRMSSISSARRIISRTMKNCRRETRKPCV